MNWIDSHSCQWRCHCWELQDQPLAFSRQFGASCIFLHDLQHALDQFSAACDQAVMKTSTKTPSYCVSPETQGCARCKWAAIHCSRWRSSCTLGWCSRATQGRRTRLINGLAKQTQFCVSFNALLSQNRSFQTPQSCQFWNRSLFRSSPMVMNLG